MNVKNYVIEDDQSIFEMIKERFLQWSFEVIGPTNFQKVIDLFFRRKTTVSNY